MSELPEVSDGTFETRVLKNSRPTIVDFWAEW
jgi:thioredoxin 1